MYAKRIQLINYGPIEKLDIEFPFEDDIPRPVILVGENGSGKSILLSHIVNGLVTAKGVAYPDTPEVETGKVYKLRSASYIRSGSECYFGRVDFEDGLFVSELRLRKRRQEYEILPLASSEAEIHDAWNQMNPEQTDYLDASSILNCQSNVEDIFSKRCVLYCPPNRFEDPAWLNEENLLAHAQYMDLKHLRGHTERKLIDYSPLHDNQNWLFEVLFDRAVLEVRIVPHTVTLEGESKPMRLRESIEYRGRATSIHLLALQIVRVITRKRDARFGIGNRNNRVVTLESDGTGQIVPNIFQLSSGETSLLDLFLSILRDADLSGTPYSQAADIRGIVVVDEIDLHLHAVHQSEVLPELIKMFPNVQFVVTTHSPLFVLGMQRVFGEDGFAVYRIPEGNQISPEEFSEFGDAYRAFTETVRFSNDMRKAIDGAQKPIVFVEGSTDEKYIRRAAQLLGQDAILEGIELRDGGGTADLRKIWKSSRTDLVPQKVVLLFDCEERLEPGSKGNLFRRRIPRQPDNPIQKGIENMFSKDTLERARQHKCAFIDIDPERTRTVRGVSQLVPEEWTINTDEKTNLCNWLCDEGTADDFQGFAIVFDLLRSLLDLHSDSPEEVTDATDTSDGGQGEGDA